MGGQRVYILSKDTKWNVIVIYTNIRQVHQAVKSLNLDGLDNILLQEIRMNGIPNEKCGKDAKYMLIQKQEELKKNHLNQANFDAKKKKENESR